MKTIKNLSIAIALFFSFSANGQGMLGFTFNQIDADFPKGDYIVKYTKNNDNGFFHLYVKTEIGKSFYYFGKDSICILSFFMPVDSLVFNEMKKSCDDNAKKISDSSWVIYNGFGNGMKVTVVSDENNPIVKEGGKYLKYSIND